MSDHSVKARNNESFQSIVSYKKYESMCPLVSEPCNESRSDIVSEVEYESTLRTYYQWTLMNHIRL